MKYKITHTTRYAYTESVPICHNLVRLAPRTTATQRCREHRLLIDPMPADRSQRTDYFGNAVDYFSIHEPHRGLTVTATSNVEVGGPGAPRTEPPSASTAWEAIAEETRADRSPAGLDALQFVAPSPHVRISRPVAEYASRSFTPGRPILDAARDLTSRIHRDFVYDTKATTVHTPLEEVLANRRGVCQDFAHVEIACFRSLGLAARYVSGYLRTEPPPGKVKLVGGDASHAWISVYAGKLGWIDFDPTNNVVVATDHVTVAWGRDYADVCPIQGVIVGGGHHSVSVAVEVTPL